MKRSLFLLIIFLTLGAGLPCLALGSYDNDQGWYSSPISPVGASHAPSLYSTTQDNGDDDTPDWPPSDWDDPFKEDADYPDDWEDPFKTPTGDIPWCMLLLGGITYCVVRKRLTKNE